MKHLTLCVVSMLLLVSPFFPFSGTALSQDTATIEVASGTICTGVVNRECVDAGIRFNASSGKLFCFTRIRGAVDPTYVTHVWYFGNRERARITLPVKSSNWRTFSSKMVLPHEIGEWHVDILTSDERLLMAVPFEVDP